MALADRAGALWTSPALVDGLLAYAVAIAVGVAVFATSAGTPFGPWPAYLFCSRLWVDLAPPPTPPGAGADCHLAWHLCVLHAAVPTHWHGPADRCGAVLSRRSRSPALTITIRDDGRGATEFVAGNGIRGMTERAAELGGDLRVTRSEGDAGTVVTAVLPWPQGVATQSAEARSER
jgi:hypothetical protein